MTTGERLLVRLPHGEGSSTERVVLRIESGDAGLIGALGPAMEKWRKKEYPKAKLLVRNGKGVALEFFVLEDAHHG